MGEITQRNARMVLRESYFNMQKEVNYIKRVKSIAHNTQVF